MSQIFFRVNHLTALNGATIVRHSSPDAEAAETRAKTRALLNAMKAKEDK